MAGPPRRHVLAYDASCGPCSRFRAVVGFLDARRRVESVSLEEADRRGLLDGITPPLRFLTFHLIPPARGRPAEGPRSGSSAVLPLAGLLLPAGSSVARIVETAPGVAGAVSFAYSALSRLHGAGACAAAAADRPPSR